MIIYKNWIDIKKVPEKTSGIIRLYCEGYFLFGIIPLYIKKVNYDINRP